MSFIPKGEEVESLMRRHVKAHDFIVLTPVRLVGPEGVAEECHPDHASHIGVSLEDDEGGKVSITNLSESRGLKRIIAFAKALNPSISVAARRGESLVLTEENPRTS